ncbi:MAG: hypothetical protein ACRDQW_04975 [Haloechinothrix sp.]
MGITTVIPFGTFYALALAALLFADPVYGLAVGATYGVARALPVLVASGAIAARANREENPHDTALIVTTRVLAWRGLTRTANGLAEAGFGTLAIATAVLTLWP